MTDSNKGPCDIMLEYARSIMVLWRRDGKKTPAENNRAYNWIIANNYNKHSAVSVETGVVMGLFGSRATEQPAQVIIDPDAKKNEEIFKELIKKEYEKTDGITPHGYLSMISTADRLKLSKDKILDLEHEVTLLLVQTIYTSL